MPSAHFTQSRLVHLHGICGITYGVFRLDNLFQPLFSFIENEIIMLSQGLHLAARSNAAILR